MRKQRQLAASAAVPMSPEALQNNERLFPMLQSQLSEENVNGNYASAAQKLAAWLSRDKAYYPAAKPWIIVLIETAQNTIRRLAGIALPRDRPFHVSQCPKTLMEHWVNPYIELIKVVRRFDHMFYEPELRARLEALLQTVDAPRPPTVRIPAHVTTHNRSASGPSTPQSASPVSHNPHAPIPGQPPFAHYIQQSPATLPYQKFIHYNGPSAPPMPAPMAMPMHVSVPPTVPYRQQVASPAQMSPYPQPSPTLVGHPTPSRPSSSSSFSAMPQRPSSSNTTRVVSAPIPSTSASPPVSISATPEASVSAPVKRKSKPKRVLTEDFMMEDVEWFRQQKEKGKEKENEEVQPETGQHMKQSTAPQPSEVAKDNCDVTMDKSTQGSSKDAPLIGETRPSDPPDASRVTAAEQVVSIADAMSAAVEGVPAAGKAADPPPQTTVQTSMSSEPFAPPTPLSVSNEGTDASTHHAKPMPSAVPDAVRSENAVDPSSSASSTKAAFTVSPTRMLDLSKLGSPTETKAKKHPIPDLVFSKVSHPPDATVAAIPNSSINATPVEGHHEASSSSNHNTTPTSNKAGTSGHVPHVIKRSTSKKGPPGIRASELLPQTQVSSSSTGASAAVQLPTGAISLQSADSPGVRFRLLPPKPPALRSEEPQGSTSEPTSATSVPETEASLADTPVSATSLLVNDLQSANAPVPVAQGIETSVTTTAVVPQAPTFSVAAGEGPIHRRASCPFESPPLKRARSGSPDLPLAQRRKSMQGTPTLPLPQEMAIRTHPREYTVEAFSSGNFVYSPVQAKTSVDPIAIEDTAINGRSSPGVLLPSLSRVNGHKKREGSQCNVEDIGPRAQAIKPEDLDKLPMFRDGSRILGLNRGRPRGNTTPLTFSFELAQAEYEACLVWSKQGDHKELVRDPSSLRCLSLSCYLFDECDDRRKTLKNPTEESIFAYPPSPFPHNQWVQLRIEGRHPPEYGVTWADLLKNKYDHLLDLSKDARPGMNKIEVYSGNPHVDHSAYVFVLRLHPLTPRQSARWWDRKRNQMDWERNLRRLSRIVVPPIDLSRCSKYLEHAHT